MADLDTPHNHPLLHRYTPVLPPPTAALAVAATAPSLTAMLALPHTSPLINVICCGGQGGEPGVDTGPFRRDMRGGASPGSYSCLCPWPLLPGRGIALQP